jgi:hypothetical protein
VLALGQGGALETVVSPERARGEGVAPTGCFFEAPQVESLIAGVARMDALLPALDRAAIRRHAERFSAPRFAPELSRAIAAIARRQGRPDLA